MADALRLFGLKAVVTNAVGGIGEATARTLVRHGATVLAVDSANSGVETHFSSVQGVHGAVIDLHAADAAAQISSAVDKELGGLDIVVCNVSPHSEAPINDGDDDELQKLLRRKNDLVSKFCRQLLPQMENSPAGRLIVVGFARSVFGHNGAESFAASTNAIAELTAQLASEAGPFGVTANYIQPGAIMTPESRRVFNNNKGFRDACIAESAAKRLGEPIDIAKVALFLASDDSVFVSGTGIIADGGKADS